MALGSRFTLATPCGNQRLNRPPKRVFQQPQRLALGALERTLADALAYWRRIAISPPLPIIPTHAYFRPFNARGPNTVTLGPLDTHTLTMRTAAPIVKGRPGLAWHVQGFWA